MQTFGLRVHVKDFGQMTEDTWYHDRDEVCYEE